MTDYKVSSRSELFLKVAVLKTSVTFTGKHLYQILFLNSIIGCRLQTYRSSHSQMFFEIDVLKNFAEFTGKHLRWSLYINKVASAACNRIKRETPAQVFPRNFFRNF